MKLNETKSFLRIPVIYGIQNTKSCKWYIGSCIDMKDRFQRHRYYLRHNSHHSPKLQRAYNLYGEDSFEVHILHFLQENEDRFILEEQYIKDYDSVANGYNILDKCKHVDGFTFSMKAKEHFLEYIKTLEKSVIAIDRFSGNIDKTLVGFVKVILIISRIMCLFIPKTLKKQKIIEYKIIGKENLKVKLKKRKCEEIAN